MPLPDPRPSLVICYAYLWAPEYDAGRDEGVKDRPCAVVLTRHEMDGEIVVTVAPVTHSLPSDPASAVEIPPATKKRLGPDSERSWIVATEVNRFVWPGPDLRPISGRQSNRFAYGYLPAVLVRRIADRILDLARKRSIKIVERSD